MFLRRYLENEVPERQNRIHCMLWRRHRVARSLDSKWFVTEDEYKSAFYPPYCAGLAYIVPSHLLRSLSEAAYDVPFFWVDDVYGTGLLTRHAHIGHRQLAPYYALHPNENAALSSNWTETMKDAFGGTQIMFAHMKTEKLRKIRSALFNSIGDGDLGFSKFVVD